MNTLSQLIANNRGWAAMMTAATPEFFAQFSRRHEPKHFWIGCSEMHMPPSQLLGLAAGDLIVHQNLGNIFAPDDAGCASALRYAVGALKIRHVIICGHYGCSEIRAVLNRDSLRLSDPWLAHIQKVRQKHAGRLSTEVYSNDRLCELNVIEQAVAVCASKTVRDAWNRRQPLCVAAWVYRPNQGMIHELGLVATSEAQLASSYERTLGTLMSGAWPQHRHNVHTAASTFY